MDFFELIKKRQSIRVFEERVVEEKKVQKIIEAANSAPSAGNLQAYEIFVVREKKKKNALAKAAFRQEVIESANLALVFFANPKRSSIKYGERGKKLYCTQDATIAATYAQLAATNLGLGSCWVGAFHEEIVSKEIGCSKELKPVCILPIGYPNETPQKKERRKIEDIVHYK